jgi:predicted Fe-S protein YdhL (DUF1289 family)
MSAGQRSTLGVRSTPCVGICSTTYGDLVCRGCKRFAHEIVAWNTYTDAQRERVWERLVQLRDAATAMFVVIDDRAALHEAVRAARLNDPRDRTELSLAYQLLRRRARSIEGVASLGLRALVDDVSSPVAIRDAIDAEFQMRSAACFEHSFHTLVDA